MEFAKNLSITASENVYGSGGGVFFAEVRSRGVVREPIRVHGESVSIGFISCPPSGRGGKEVMKRGEARPGESVRERECPPAVAIWFCFNSRRGKRSSKNSGKQIQFCNLCTGCLGIVFVFSLSFSEYHATLLACRLSDVAKNSRGDFASQSRLKDLVSCSAGPRRVPRE